jgi:prepilin-type N-terminal cleavage/methylation domain-containing protein
MRCRPAFTLIELLIVVAIIAILAAIAVPHFLAAQTRAKVSRVRADMRTVATALESYRTDWAVYPSSRGANCETDPVHRYDGYGRLCRAGFRTISLRLSTPVAYLTRASIEDPFKGSASEGGWPYASENPADAALGYHNIYEIALIDMEDGWYPDDFYVDYGSGRTGATTASATLIGTGSMTPPTGPSAQARSSALTRTPRVSTTPSPIRRRGREAAREISLHPLHLPRPPRTYRGLPSPGFLAPTPPRDGRVGMASHARSSQITHSAANPDLHSAAESLFLTVFRSLSPETGGPISG